MVMPIYTLGRFILVAAATTLTVFRPAVLRSEVPEPLPGEQLYKAAEGGALPAIKELLKNGTAVDARNSQGRTALIAAVSERQREATKLLIDRGADVNAQSNNETGTHVLTWAAIAGDEEIVKLLLEKGAKTDVRAHNGLSPLCGAVNKGQTGVVRVLLERGADPDFAGVTYSPKQKQQDRLIPPLLLAAHNGTGEIVNMLLDKGASIGAADSSGDDALMYAARNGQLEVVELLLNRRANPKHCGQEGHTALVYAAYNGPKSIVTLLLNAGANPFAVVDELHDDGHRSRFDAESIAEEKGHSDIADLIRQFKSRPKTNPPKRA